MMMMNEKRTPFKPRIHDQILKPVGEAAHPHRDERVPDLENNTYFFPSALQLALKLGWGPRPSFRLLS